MPIVTGTTSIVTSHTCHLFVSSETPPKQAIVKLRENYVKPLIRDDNSNTSDVWNVKLCKLSI